eukprot:752294-Rhodomonas_salina.1
MCPAECLPTSSGRPPSTDSKPQPTSAAQIVPQKRRNAIDSGVSRHALRQYRASRSAGVGRAQPEPRASGHAHAEANPDQLHLPIPSQPVPHFPL